MEGRLSEVWEGRGGGGRSEAEREEIGEEGWEGEMGAGKEEQVELVRGNERKKGDEAVK